jgi:hypothetical protein
VAAAAVAAAAAAVAAAAAARSIACVAVAPAVAVPAADPSQLALPFCRSAAAAAAAAAVTCAAAVLHDGLSQLIRLMPEATVAAAALCAPVLVPTPGAGPHPTVGGVSALQTDTGWLAPQAAAAAQHAPCGLGLMQEAATAWAAPRSLGAPSDQLTGPSWLASEAAAAAAARHVCGLGPMLEAAQTLAVPLRSPEAPSVPRLDALVTRLVAAGPAVQVWVWRLAGVYHPFAHPCMA